MNEPLVSVICLCYNHRDFVIQAMTSVLEQSYSNTELIVVDDASTDGSQDVIEDFCKTYPEVKTLLLTTNEGNCKAFNQGWRLARGKYIIDLAADDYLLPGRISLGVQNLEEKGPEFGVHFTDVRQVNRQGKQLSDHRVKDYLDPVPVGDIFKELLSRYFINPVSMMFTNTILEQMEGYDESLAYEDFDFWVRSSRQYKYCYSPEIMVVKRLLAGSHSTSQYKYRSTMLESTYKVCEKAYRLCQTKTEYRALLLRLRFERRKAFQSLNIRTGKKFTSLLGQVRTKIKELS